MDLHSEMIFTGSTRPRISIEIPEQPDTDDKLTLALKGLLTPAIAEQLGCLYLYAKGRTPQAGFKEITLDARFVDFELRLTNGAETELETIYPESAYGFRIYKIGEDQKLMVQMKIDLTGNFNPLLDFFRANREAGFQFAIRSRQGKLFGEEAAGLSMELPSDDEEPFREEPEPKQEKKRQRAAAPVIQ